MNAKSLLNRADGFVNASVFIATTVKGKQDANAFRSVLNLFEVNFMQTLQQNLFDPSPTVPRSEDRRKTVAVETFERQTLAFKARFEEYLNSYLNCNKGKRFSFPDITEKYATFKSQPQPLKDFRCVGYLAIRYQKLGRIKQVSTTKDKKSKRIIPIYEVL